MVGKNGFSTRAKWWISGAVGAFVFGSGLALSIEAGHWKNEQSPWSWWVFSGTIGIGMCLSGVVLLIKAGILRERLRKENKQN